VRFPCSLFVGLLERKCHFLIKDSSGTFLFTLVSIDLFSTVVLQNWGDYKHLTIYYFMTNKISFGFDDSG